MGCEYVFSGVNGCPLRQADARGRGVLHVGWDVFRMFSWCVTNRRFARRLSSLSRLTWSTSSPSPGVQHMMTR